MVGDTALIRKFSAHNRYIAHNEIDPISILSGLVQTGLYLDFFYGTSHSHLEKPAQPARHFALQMDIQGNNVD